MKLKSTKIGVIGLGYVGLPLAVEFSKKRDVLGFDIDKNRVQELKNGKDSTLEISSDQIIESKRLTISDNKELLKDNNVFIVTVPTPIDKYIFNFDNLIIGRLIIMSININIMLFNITRCAQGLTPLMEAAIGGFRFCVKVLPITIS